MKSITIATKINSEAAAVLRDMCESRGVKIYNLLQWCVHILIRMHSGRYELSPHIHKLLALLECQNGYANTFNFAETSCEEEAAQILLFTRQKGKKGKGVRLVTLGENPIQTMCVDDILELTIDAAMPGVYRRLRRLAVSLGCSSIAEVLITLADEQADEAQRLEDVAEAMGTADHHRGGTTTLDDKWRKPCKKWR